MKAAILSGVGGRILYKDIQMPKVGSDEALLKVSYCGINHLDLLISQGKRPGPNTFPHVLGSEIVGEIVKLPQKKGTFRVGETVAVYPWTFCGRCPQCVSGNEQICETGGTIGRTRWGGYAEYVAVPMQNLLSVSQTLPKDHLCALILAGTTAVHLLKRAGVSDGSSVLVTGATGGVGTILVQLLRRKKCVVVCATSHANKTKKILELGADHVVLTKNMFSKVKKMLPMGAEYVIDIVGGDIWSQALQMLSKNGTMAFCSTSRDEIGKVDIASAFSKQVNIHGSYGGSRKDLTSIMSHFENKEIKPIIDTVFPLSHAAFAFEKMEQQNIFGKTLLHCPA